MPRKRIIDFMSPAECAEVAAWALDPATNAQMLHLTNTGDRADGVVNRMTQALTGTKHTNRLRLIDNVPAIVNTVYERIMDLDPPDDFLGANPRATKREWISRIIVHNPSTDTTEHDDIVRTLQHWRANIVCQAPTAGGMFKIANADVPVAVGELMVFNANTVHTLTEITEGQRVILTFGWLWEV